MGYSNSHFNVLFASGRYQEVLDAYDTSPEKYPKSQLSSVIASMCQTGRYLEAEALLRSISRVGLKSDHRQLRICHFWLALALVRQGQSKKSLDLLKKISAGDNKDPSTAFWSQQGHAFYHFYRGEIAKALGFATAAVELATEAQDNQMKVLALDVLGQTQVSLGEIFSGLKTIEQAKKIAKSEGWTHLTRAFKVSLAIFRAQFGLDPEKSLASLSTLLSQGEFIDSYYQSYLRIEVARQHMLRGNWSEAQQTLDRAMEFVFASKNRRLEVLFYVRYCHLQLCFRNWTQVELLLRSAKMVINLELDQYFGLVLADIEYRLLSLNGQIDRANDVKDAIIERSVDYGSIVNSNILVRRGWITGTISPQDKIAQLKDRFANGKNLSQIGELVNAGYLGLVGEALGILPTDKVLLLDLTPGKLTVFSPTGCRVIESTVSALNRKMLLQISTNGSKEALITQVWGYKYNPIRHDSLIYTAINSLRNFLGTASTWIELSESGYFLHSDVRLREFQAQPTPSSAMDASTDEPSALVLSPVFRTELLDSERDDLNFRQLKILRYLQRNECVDAPKVAEQFGVSLITALRDLSGLVSRGRLRRLGKARATKYILIG